MKKYLFLLLLFFCSCNLSKPTSYRIGVDPYWYGLNATGKQENIHAFCIDLLQAIAQEENLNLSFVQTSWDNLVMDLKNGKYEGMFSPMQPYNFLKDQYDFSEVFLPTGPVLITRVGSKLRSLDKLEGKEVATINSSADTALLEKSKGILIREYTSIPEALNDVARGVIDGAVLGTLLAQGYVRDLYNGQLEIATDPLTDEGLRLVTLHGKNDRLLKLFDQGLNKVKKSKDYSKIASKWKVG